MTYDFLCQDCNSIFEQILSFSEYDLAKLKDELFSVECPNCPNTKVKRNYDICPHVYSVNNNIAGTFIEKNTKKIGKTKIEEEYCKKQESLKPKAKEGWFGKLPDNKKKEIFNPKKNIRERQKAVKNYILEGK